MVQVSNYREGCKLAANNLIKNLKEIFGIYFIRETMNEKQYTILIRN